MGIYSSSSVFAMERFGSADFFLKKQLVGLVLGLCAGLFCWLMPMHTLERLSPFFYIISLLLTCATLIPGIGMHIHGSQRWLKLGFFAFQPSELLKVATILYGAFLLTKHHLFLNTFRKGLLPVLCITAVTCFVLLMQPDFGQAVAIGTTMLIMAFIAGVQMRALTYIALPTIPLIGMLVYLKAYRFKRILIFLNPWADPQGAGFQIIQSLIAIGSGGWFGVGIAQSKQKFFYLPMQHTDFIFSIIAEETGLVGSLFIIALYCALLYAGIRVARHAKSTFSYLVIVGCITLLSLQAVLNICVVTGLLPTKGMGLPFISYGKSALIVDWMMIGLIAGL
jgi:cell division protein FtsW